MFLTIKIIVSYFLVLLLFLAWFIKIYNKIPINKNCQIPRWLYMILAIVGTLIGIFVVLANFTAIKLFLLEGQIGKISVAYILSGALYGAVVAMTSIFIMLIYSHYKKYKTS